MKFRFGETLYWRRREAGDRMKIRRKTKSRELSLVLHRVSQSSEHLLLSHPRMFLLRHLFYGLETRSSRIS